MNDRIKFEDLRDRLEAIVSAQFQKIGTAYDPNYLADVKLARVSVWLTSQRSTRVDEGRTGFTGNNRQKFRVEVLIRVVVPRTVSGQGSQEPVLSDKVNAVILAMKGYTPPGAEMPFILDSSRDGDPIETILYTELIFATLVVYQETV